MKKSIILVCAHKPDKFTRNSGIYRAIQVGKANNPELDLGYLCDNAGDNISKKNPLYSELTAMYWAWKNLFNVDYIGICHYRRYFDIDITEENISNIMMGVDVVLTKKLILTFSNMTNLETLITKEDTHILFDEILKQHPDSRSALIDYAINSNNWILCNMMICKKELFDDYCNFAFPVLLEVEKKIKLSGYSRLRRTMGYMGEFMWGLYVIYRKFKVREVPMLQCDIENNKTSFFKQIYINNKINLGFILCRGFKKIKSIIPYPATVVGLKNDGIELNNFIK